MTKEYFILVVNKIDLLAGYKKDQPISSEVMESCEFYSQIQSFVKANSF